MKFFSSCLRVALLCAFLQSGFLTTDLVAEEENGEKPALQAEVSAYVNQLPIPPDARELEYRIGFQFIEFISGSSLGSLLHFYREEMADRGWEEDEEETEIEEDSVDLTFKFEDMKVEVDLSERSKGIQARITARGLNFEGTNDPAAMVKAGLPQPRAYLYLQKHIPPPEDAIRLEYYDDEYRFYSKMKFLDSFNLYFKKAEKLGFRESRKPYVSKDYQYTELKKGPITLIIKAYVDEIGSRTHIGYKNEQKEQPIPPLKHVALAMKGKAPDAGSTTPTDPSDPSKPKIPTGGIPVDVSRNKGKATIKLGDKTWVFTHAAAYQVERYDEMKTTLLFTNKEIPLEKMQALLSKKREEDEYFDVLDVYEVGIPDYFMVTLDEYGGFSFNGDGIGIGNSAKDAIRDVKIENNRIVAKVKTKQPKEIFDKPFTFEVSIEAGLMSPVTRVTNAPKMIAKASDFGDQEVPLPEGYHEASGGGTEYRKSMTAKIRMSLQEVQEFYEAQAKAKNWQFDTKASKKNPNGSIVMAYIRAGGPTTVVLTPKGKETTIEISVVNLEAAKRDGMLPEEGKCRLIMANAFNQEIVITIGKTDYKIKAGRGAKDPRQGLNYTVPAGKYPLVIKVPGKAPQKETLNITTGTAWGVIVLPNGITLADRLF